jgi:hypothetical protein
MAITVAGVNQGDAFYSSLGLISVSYLSCFFLSVELVAEDWFAGFLFVRHEMVY